MTTEDETSAKRLEPTEDGTTGSSGGAGSDDCGRSTHPEVAPSHGRPAREHRVGLRPDDERAHGARATGAARAIARARISSVPTTTSAGDSNTRETIDVRARKTESRSEVEPDTPSSALLLPQRPARGGTARRGIPLRARMSDAGRAAIVFGVIPLSSALLCWVAMGWWSVKTRRDRRRVATLRHRASARPSPSSRTTSERAPLSPSLTPRTPPPPSPPPLRAQAAAHRTSRGRLGDDRRARSRGVPRRVPRADPSYASRPRRRALRVRDRRARARLASRGGFADPAGFARRRGRRRRGGQGLRVRPGVGGGGGRARRPVPAARGRQEHPGRHERQVQRHLRAHGRRGVAEGRRRRRRPVEERGAAEPESRVRRYRNRRRGREAPNARREPVVPRNDRPERVCLRRFEPLETFASLPVIDAIPL